MFLVLPASDSFTHDQTRWFTDLGYAYECAVQWSSELSGQMVNLYELYNGRLIVLIPVVA